MRGFFGAALVLVALDLALTSPSARLAQLVALPAGWLAQWMSADTPLISRPVPGSSTNGGDPGNTPSNDNSANRINGAPQGTPPNPGTPPINTGGAGHVIFPPGSQNL